MKNFLLFLLLLFPCFVFADDNIKQVLMIESYKYNDLNNYYEHEQYWSAVLIEKNLIYTNAHVILDENDEPIWNYRVCKTIDFKERPECFSAWELIYYDKKNDLAVLKTVDTKIAPVVFSDKSLEIWDVVKVYWYPSNWGNTITYTEWKISWYEKGLYKIDANLDAWNSWWWVFDSDWKLVWISVAVVEWYTTLGYIIPIEKINNFKNKSNLNDITTYDSKISSAFFAYEKMLDKAYTSNNFDNSLVSINNINKYWFNVDYYESDMNKKYYYLELIDKEGYNWIIINNITYHWNKSSVLDSIINYYKMTLNEVKESDNLKIYKIKKIKIKGFDSFIMIKWYDDNTVTVNLRIEVDKNNHTEIIIYWDKISDKSFNKWLKLALKEINIKKTNLVDSNQTDYYRIGNLMLDKVEWFYIRKSIDTELLKYDTEKDIEILNWPTITEYDSKEVNNYTMLSILKEAKELFKDNMYINELKVLKSNSWINYIYIFWINNESRSEDVIDWANKYFISVTIFDKKNEDKINQYIFKFTFNKPESKIIIDKLLKSISTKSWKNVLELWDIKIWENLIKEQEFEFWE